MAKKYGKSSFFEDEGDASRERNTPGQSHQLEYERIVPNELRMIPTSNTGSALIEPAWSRYGFQIRDEAKSAYESSNDLESRRKAGLGISMRFPASRSALWDAEPQGLPTHLTHALSIPSIFFPQDLIASIQKSFLGKNTDGEWEVHGRLETVDHQLCCPGSTTRNDNQLVFERFQKIDSEQSEIRPLDPEHEIRAKLTCISLKDLGETCVIRPRIFTGAFLKSAQQRISEQLKNRRFLPPAMHLVYGIGCLVENGQLLVTAEALVPCESYVITPLKLLKIIPTVLAQNLFDRNPSLNKSCTGFLTLDQTRRILVLKEEDPKASQLPLVGIWVSGVDTFHSPFVWAALLRYRNCQGLGERVTQRGSFLLLCYQQSAFLQPPRLAQVTVQSGQGMVARHQSTRILEADQAFCKASSQSKALKPKMIPEDTFKGLRIDFEQDSIDYCYLPESVDCADKNHLHGIDFGPGPVAESKTIEKEIQVHQAAISDSNVNFLQDFSKHREVLELLQVENSKTECYSHQKAVEEGTESRHLQAHKPPAAQYDNFHSRSAVEFKPAPPPSTGRPTSHAGMDSDAHLARSGVNFMLAANIRTLSSNDKSDGVVSLANQIDRRLKRSPHDWNQAHHYNAQVSPQQIVERASRNPKQELNVLPVRSEPQISFHESCDHDWMNCISNVDAKNVGRPYQSDRPSRERNSDLSVNVRAGENQSTPLQRQLESQQRQIEALQAALCAMQSRITPFDGQDGRNKVQEGTSNSSFTGQQYPAFSPSRILETRGTADVETQLSINSNSAFFNTRASGNAIPSTFENGTSVLIEKVGQVQIKQAQCVSEANSSPMDRIVLGKVQCIARDGGRCGGGRDSNICIFEDELTGSHKNSHFKDSGAFINLSYPGAAPHEHFGKNDVDRNLDPHSDSTHADKKTSRSDLLEAARKTDEEFRGFHKSRVYSEEEPGAFEADTVWRFVGITKAKSCC